MEDLRKLKSEREQFNEAQGIKVDVDFQVMVEQNMRIVPPMRNVSSLNSNIVKHIPADQLKICVCVKKRPVFVNELANGNFLNFQIKKARLTVYLHLILPLLSTSANTKLMASLNLWTTLNLCSITPSLT